MGSFGNNGNGHVQNLPVAEKPFDEYTTREKLGHVPTPEELQSIKDVDRAREALLAENGATTANMASYFIECGIHSMAYAESLTADHAFRNREPLGLTEQEIIAPTQLDTRGEDQLHFLEKYTTRMFKLAEWCKAGEEALVRELANNQFMRRVFIDSMSQVIKSNQVETGSNGLQAYLDAITAKTDLENVLQTS